MFCPLDGTGRRGNGRGRTAAGSSELIRAKEPIVHFLYNLVLCPNIIPSSWGVLALILIPGRSLVLRFR